MGAMKSLRIPPTHSDIAVKQEKRMKCQRCAGIMVSEEFYGSEEMFSGWRCIFCGEVIDPVILQNRMIQKRRGISLRLRRGRLVIPSIREALPLGLSR